MSCEAAVITSFGANIGFVIRLMTPQPDVRNVINFVYLELFTTFTTSAHKSRMKVVGFGDVANIHLLFAIRTGSYVIITNCAIGRHVPLFSEKNR